MTENKKSLPPNPKNDAVNALIPNTLVSSGVYSNLAIISHSKNEFLLNFLFHSPEDNILQVRVITNPAHAKRLAVALTENVEKYEAIHGKIDIGE